MSNSCVLVTRPDPQGTQLCELITAQGGSAIHFPTIAFAPPPDISAFEQAIKRLHEQDWLIFNSPQAVYASKAAIQQAFPHFPRELNVAAIGEGTRHVLEEAGIMVNAQPDMEWSSEGLLKLPVFQSVKNKKIAIIRGVGGREFLDKTLTERGAQVLPVIAYERILPQVDVSEYEKLLKNGAIHTIVCTSFEGVRNLKILLGPISWQYIKVIPLIVISERIKILAEDLGFQTIWVAQNASSLAILEMLEKRQT